MRRLPVAVALLALALGSGAAGGGRAAAPATIGLSGEVVSIAADGGRVVAHAREGSDPRDSCEHAAVWTPGGAAVARLPEPRCAAQSDAQFAGVALAGARAAWASYDFGNHAYCTGPWTAIAGAARATDLGLCPDEPDSADKYWSFAGDGDLLVAETYDLCEAGFCGESVPDGRANVTLYRVAAKARKIATLKPNGQLLDVQDGRILALEPGGELVVLDGSGTVLNRIVLGKGLVDFARLAGAGTVVVRKGSVLTLYGALDGRRKGERMLPSGRSLKDVYGMTALTVGGGALHLLNLVTGAERTVAKVIGFVEADLEPGGVFWGWNDPSAKGNHPGRFSYVRR